MSTSVTSFNNLWVSTPNHNAQARMWLFCFPFAGGGTAAYHTWAKALPPEIALCSIRLPGRESRIREAPYVRMEPLVQDLAQILAPHFDRPFVFFGHSMGALIAFELARHLRRHNMRQPLHLFASGHRAPQIPDPEPPLFLLPNDEFVREMDERYNGIPAPILENPELLELFLPVMRSDVTILDNYGYRDDLPLDCPVTAYGGDQDPSVRQAHLDAWRQQTTGEFQKQIFPGDHFFLQSAQSLLLQDLNAALSQHLQGVP